MKMKMINESGATSLKVVPIVGLAGQKGVGKSTTAQALAGEEDAVYAFATKVRTHASLMLKGLTTRPVPDHLAKNQTVLGDTTWRDMLQMVGAFFRSNVHPDYWIDQLALHTSYVDGLSTIAPNADGQERWTPGEPWKGVDKPTAYIDDVRYTNEAEYIRKNGGFVIGLRTGPFDQSDGHESEQLQDRWEEMVDIEVNHDYEGEGVLQDFIVDTLNDNKKIRRMSIGQTITSEDPEPDTSPTSNDREHTYIYVAGPYSEGDSEQNAKRAIHLSDDLAKLGFVPIIPHLSNWWHEEVAQHDYQFWMNYTVSLLAICDGLYRLDGHSPGADDEGAYARRHDIPVVASKTELLETFGIQEKHLTQGRAWWTEREPQKTTVADSLGLSEEEEQEVEQRVQEEESSPSSGALADLIEDGDWQDPSTWSPQDQMRVMRQSRPAATESGDTDATDPENPSAWEGGEVPGKVKEQD